MKRNFVSILYAAGVLILLLDSQTKSQTTAAPNRVTIPPPSQLRAEKIVRLTTNGQYYMCPTWSHDGNMIAFTRAKYTGIEVMNSDGSNRRVLTNDLGAGDRFSWSADSKEIAYRATEFIDGKRYYFVRKAYVSTGQVQQLSEPAMDVQPPHWSYFDGEKCVSFISGTQRINTTRVIAESPLTFPWITGQSNVNKILYFHNNNIWIMDETGSQRKQLTYDVGFSPIWAPDRTKIVYSHWDTLIVINPDASDKVVLGRGNLPTWAPDSKKIVYQITTDDGHKITGSDLYIINADGTERIQLTDTANEFEVEPCWSPDGQRICYRSENTGQIYVLILRPVNNE